MEFDSPTGSIGGAMQAYYPDTTAKMVSVPNMKQRLALAVKQAEDQLAAVREAQEIFEKNPDLERLLDLMQRNRF